MSDIQFSKMMKGYTLTTAEILYRMPDYPQVLQSFVWQDFDLHPRFPKLRGFLSFWQENLDGKLFRVTVAHKELIGPTEFRLLNGEFVLH